MSAASGFFPAASVPLRSNLIQLWGKFYLCLEYSVRGTESVTLRRASVLDRCIRNFEGGRKALVQLLSLHRWEVEAWGEVPVTLGTLLILCLRGTGVTLLRPPVSVHSCPLCLRGWRALVFPSSLGEKYLGEGEECRLFRGMRRACAEAEMPAQRTCFSWFL